MSSELEQAQDSQVLQDRAPRMSHWSDPERDHDVALCGADLRGRPYCDEDEPVDCVVCCSLYEQGWWLDA